MSPGIRLNIAQSGAVAWLLTVGGPLLRQPARVSTWALAVAALVSLGVGLFARGGASFLARPAFLYGFCGACAGVWTLCGEELSAQVGGVGGALGAIVWLGYALAWGATRRPSAVPEAAPGVIRAELLAPRRTLPALTFATFVLAVGFGLAVWCMAWVVDGRERGLFAHAVALAFAIGFLISGTQTAIALGHSRRMRPPRIRLSGAVPALWLVALLVAAYFWLRNS